MEGHGVSPMQRRSVATTSKGKRRGRSANHSPDVQKLCVSVFECLKYGWILHSGDTRKLEETREGMWEYRKIMANNERERRKR